MHSSWPNTGHERRHRRGGIFLEEIGLYSVSILPYIVQLSPWTDEWMVGWVGELISIELGDQTSFG